MPMSSWWPRVWWRSLASRERGLLLGMALVLLAALAWFLLVSPALRVLRNAPGQIAALEVQAAAMQRMAAQARGLQARAPLARDDALRALEASVRQRLGSTGQLSANGDRVTVVLRDAPPQAIAPWLSQARQQAQVVASQANLTRGPGGWSGSVVFNLPAAP